MDTSFTLAYATGLLFFWSGIGTTVWRVVQMACRVSLSGAVRFAVVSIALAVASYVPAAVIGAWAFCLSSTGGLCALGGYVGTGLVAAGVALLYRSFRALREPAAS